MCVTPLHPNKHPQRQEDIEKDCALDKFMKYGQPHNRKRLLKSFLSFSMVGYNGYLWGETPRAKLIW